MGELPTGETIEGLRAARNLAHKMLAKERQRTGALRAKLAAAEGRVEKAERGEVALCNQLRRALDKLEATDARWVAAYMRAEAAVPLIEEARMWYAQSIRRSRVMRQPNPEAEAALEQVDVWLAQHQSGEEGSDAD